LIRDVESGAIETVLNKLDGIFSRKEEQTTALRAFVGETDVLLCLTFGKGFG